jgi:hypothetical protein
MTSSLLKKKSLHRKTLSLRKSFLERRLRMQFLVLMLKEHLVLMNYPSFSSNLFGILLKETLLSSLMIGIIID